MSTPETTDRALTGRSRPSRSRRSDPGDTHARALPIYQTTSYTFDNTPSTPPRCSELASRATSTPGS